METSGSNTMKKTVLVISCLLMAIGNCGGPLISRLYFIYGGKRIWLSTWTQTVGCPINLIPLTISYFIRRKNKGPDAKLTLMRFPTFVASIFLGLLVGVSAYTVAVGMARLPVSTSTLILATQLAFTTFFAFIIVKQKFTSYTINAVVLLTVGAVLLGLHANSDRPEGEGQRLYVLGFILTLISSACVGLYYNLAELVYKKTKQAISFTLIMEMQLAIAFVANVFATVGMLVNKDFQAIPREAREFQLGIANYYVVLVFSAIVWQCSFLGLVGTLFSTSALVTGIIVTVLLPVTQVLAVMAYHEKFKAEKGVALVLSLWGFASYFYGELKQDKKKRAQAIEAEVTAIGPNVAP